MRVGKEDGETNLADPFTKVLGRMKRYEMFSKITYSSMYGKEGPPRADSPAGTTSGNQPKRARVQDH
jgi:hypothetical protein